MIPKTYKIRKIPNANRYVPISVILLCNSDNPTTPINAPNGKNIAGSNDILLKLIWKNRIIGCESGNATSLLSIDEML